METIQYLIAGFALRYVIILVVSSVIGFVFGTKYTLSPKIVYGTYNPFISALLCAGVVIQHGDTYPVPLLVGMFIVDIFGAKGIRAENVGTFVGKFVRKTKG